MIWWKLGHWFFGWDYVAWRNSADEGVARVHLSGDGKAYYWRYKITKVLDHINNQDQVTWLTCHPSKYLNNA